jgi:peptide/nickel transport system substrate-binding protein
VPVAFPISALALSDRVLSYPASPVLNEVFTKVQLKP